MDRDRAKGVITVFFSLISVIILSLIGAALESARMSGARAQTGNVTDMGNYSVFGEYEKKLLEDYEIFGVDGAYGSGDFSIGRVKDRWKSYMQYNAQPNADGIAMFCFDPWQISLTDAQISEYALLTDRQGMSFYQQAVAYMRETAVTGILGRLFDYYQDAETAREKQEEYENREQNSDQAMNELEQIEEEKRQEIEDAKREAAEAGTVLVLENDPARINIENPLKALWRLKRMGIVEAACGNQPISVKSVPYWQRVSTRYLEKGNLKLKETYGGLLDDLIFREYLLDYFPNFRSDEKKGKLDYQLEYILCGNGYDRENLKEVLGKLLLIREGLNYSYLLADPASDGEASMLAFMLIGWTGMTGLVEILKQAILLGWAYGESMLDLRILMEGGKVPLMKTEQSWKISLENLYQVIELLNQGGSSSQEGLSYRDYLRILLNLQLFSNQKMRALDMLEFNIREESGLSNFRADHCVVGIKGKTTWNLKPVFSRISGAFLGLMQADTSAVVETGFAY